MISPQKPDISNVFNNELTTGKDCTGDKKKQIIFQMPEKAKKRFDHLAIEIGKTKQSLMAEAINDLFLKYGKPPIA